MRLTHSGGSKSEEIVWYWRFTLRAAFLVYGRVRFWCFHWLFGWKTRFIFDPATGFSVLYTFDTTSWTASRQRRRKSSLNGIFYDLFCTHSFVDTTVEIRYVVRKRCRSFAASFLYIMSYEPIICRKRLVSTSIEPRSELCSNWLRLPSRVAPPDWSSPSLQSSPEHDHRPSSSSALAARRSLLELPKWPRCTSSI